MILELKEAIADLRSELMYEHDWMDYAEAHQTAYDTLTYFDDLEEDDECDL